MNKLLKLSFYCSLVLFLGLSACGDDDDDDNVNCNTIDEDLQAEAEAIGTAFANFLTEDTEANCNAFIAALDDYIDFISQFRSCLEAAQQEELDDAIEAFEATRDANPCAG